MLYMLTVGTHELEYEVCHIIHPLKILSFNLLISVMCHFFLKREIYTNIHLTFHLSKCLNGLIYLT